MRIGKPAIQSPQVRAATLTSSGVADTLTQKRSADQLPEISPAPTKANTTWRTSAVRAVRPGSSAAQESAKRLVLPGRSAIGAGSRPIRWKPRDSRPSAVAGWRRTVALIAATEFSTALAGGDHPA